MIVNDILSRLTFIELQALSLSGFSTPTKSISPEDYAEVSEYLNTALYKLSIRFPIQDKELRLIPTAGQAFYELLPINALSSGMSDWFIQDSVDEPFTGDILNILAAYTEMGLPLPINDTNNRASIFTPSYNTIQLQVNDLSPIYLTYRSEPTVIVAPDITDAEAVDTFLNTPINLPRYLKDPLVLYVQHLVFGSKSDQESQVYAANALNKYEVAAAEVETRNLMQTQHLITEIDIRSKGFI